jgi:excisionase family DNA binding protein
MNNISTPIVPERNDWRDRTTVSVEEAGKVLGLGRSAAYRCVNSGEIPSIKLGGKFLVPTTRLRLLLGELESGNDDTAANRG